MQFIKKESPLEMMKREQQENEKRAEEAAARRAEQAKLQEVNRSFFKLQDGMCMEMRPLCSLDNALAIPMHRRFAKDKSQSINAICGEAVGQSCVYCATVKQLLDEGSKESSKAAYKLDAKLEYYIPIYIYGVRYTKDIPATQYEAFHSRNSQLMVYNAEGEGRPFTGIRLFMFAMTGTLEAPTTLLMNKELRGEDITGYRYYLTRTGGGTDTEYLLEPLAPTAIEPRLAEVVKNMDFSAENFYGKVSAIYPVAPPVSPVYTPPVRVIEEKQHVIEGKASSSESSLPVSDNNYDF